MRLMFAISVASFCTVLWLALSLARRIRRDRLGFRQPALKPMAVEFFEAGEFRTPRALRLNQEIAQQGLRRNVEETAAVPGPPRSKSQQTAPLRVPLPEPNLAVVGTVNVPEAVVIGSKLHFLIPGPAGHVEPLLRDMLPSDISGERKSPQSARSGTFRRVDLSHYNQDMGDLTDPYTNSPRIDVRPSVAKNA